MIEFQESSIQRGNSSIMVVLQLPIVGLHRTFLLLRFLMRAVTMLRLLYWPGWLQICFTLTSSHLLRYFGFKVHIGADDPSVHISCFHTSSLNPSFIHPLPTLHLHLDARIELSVTLPQTCSYTQFSPSELISSSSGQKHRTIP